VHETDIEVANVEMAGKLLGITSKKRRQKYLWQCSTLLYDICHRHFTSVLDQDLRFLQSLHPSRMDQTVVWSSTGRYWLLTVWSFNFKSKFFLFLYHNREMIFFLLKKRQMIHISSWSLKAWSKKRKKTAVKFLPLNKASTTVSGSGFGFENSHFNIKIFCSRLFP